MPYPFAMRMTNALSELLTVRSRPVDVRIYCSDAKEKAVAPAQIHAPANNSRELFWDNLAFGLVWLGALWAIGYCFLAFLSLSERLP